jgi:alpha-tubulin suppressor-like RCC1 family protein
MVTFSEASWIQLDVKAAGVELNPEIKPTVVMGKNHGFLWIKEKSQTYSFGDNSYEQLGSDIENSASVNFLYKVSCPNGLSEICALDTFTAMLNTEGDVYITGLFMVNLKDSL